MSERMISQRVIDPEQARAMANAMAPHIDQALKLEAEAELQREQTPNGVEVALDRKDHAERLDIYAGAHREVAEENSSRVVNGLPLPSAEEQDAQVETNAFIGMTTRATVNRKRK